MKEAKIDVSKEVCLDPVAKIKSVLEQIKEQNIIVKKIEIFGNQSLEGIENFLINHGYIFETIGSEESFNILLKGKEEIEVLDFLEEKVIKLEDKILFLKDDRIGEGELGKTLLNHFFLNLSKGSVFPKEIFLLNRAVLLCSDSGREVLQDLQYLQRKGVKILACKTCLEHYKILDKMKVGEVSSSVVMVEKIMGASSVINL